RTSVLLVGLSVYPPKSCSLWTQAVARLSNFGIGLGHVAKLSFTSHADGGHRFVEGTCACHQAHETPPRHSLRQRLGLGDLCACTTKLLDQPAHQLSMRRRASDLARFFLPEVFQHADPHLRVWTAGVDRSKDVVYIPHRAIMLFHPGADLGARQLAF